MKTTKSKAKMPAKPVKPKHTLIKLWLEDDNELSALADIKRLTRIDVGSKAIIEAMLNYPKVLKRADGLNAELQKLSRELENVNRDMETIRRAFNVINGTAPKPKPKPIDDDDDDDDVCEECGNNDFFANGQCTECGTDKND